MKYYLLVGGGPEWAVHEEALAQLSAKLYCVSAIPTLYPELMTKAIQVDFRKWADVCQQITDLQVVFDAVLCLDEALTHIADKLAKHLELAPLSRLDSQPFRYKDRMRMICESHGIKTPNYYIIHDYHDTEVLAMATYPLIVKPTCFLASIGVKKVNTFQELQGQVNQQLHLKYPLYLDATYELGEAYGLENRVLCESFIEGAEYSLESVVTSSGYQVLGITKKITDEGLFMDEIGHIFPAKLPEVFVQQVRAWGEKLHNSLGICNTVTHAEFRVTESGDIYLIEIGARIGGDKISRLMSYNATNDFNIIETYLSARQGEIKSNQQGNQYIGIAFVKLAPEFYGKVFKALEFAEITSSILLESEIVRAVGEVMPDPINWSNERLGYCILKNNDYDQLKIDLEKVSRSSKATFI